MCFINAEFLITNIARNSGIKFLKHTEVEVGSEATEKQAASSAKYKAPNEKKVIRASSIINYKTNNGWNPEIMKQAMEPVYEWAEL